MVVPDGIGMYMDGTIDINVWGVKNRTKTPSKLSAIAFVHYPCLESFQPLSYWFTPKKRGSESFGYFRFLSAKKATTPTTAIMTTAIMASSVVPKANAVSGSSVSIGCAGDGASETPYVLESAEVLESEEQDSKGVYDVAQENVGSLSLL